MTLKMRGFDKLEKKKFCVKAYWRKTVIPALVQICVTVFISKHQAKSSALCSRKRWTFWTSYVIIMLLFIPMNFLYLLWLIYTVWIIVWKDLMTIFDAYYAKKPWKFGIKLMMISDAYCVSIEWRNSKFLSEYQMPTSGEPD